MPNTIVSKASTIWNGELFSGSGTTSLDTSGAGTFDVGWKARGEEAGATTTPEELIASAHATCYSMQFANMLTENGTPPTRLNTGAEVSFVAGAGITGIHLTVVGEVAGISGEDFERLADEAKRTCPVSQALSAVDITLTSSLA
ncbi:OsmC family peroxiredoxin [Leucobacter ruminantium]|uniref:OsmC family peroxiredoxin n=1 Tax=Leucobacter ruminantium TaxID=1289170 RepID=A0A939LTH5_9MICO|nr:OsmC family peroxiredoxin [Leucobacter ruminantium]MBO1804102.1 OsmC family peroxiredoxin [Leucobacter ruminantium]